MNTHTIARANIERGAIILEEAQRLAEKQFWNLAVRRCQEVTELALKGALLWASLNVPKTHDVSAFLHKYQERFPTPFATSIPELASISRALRVERECSFYGDEASGIPPEQLYTADDAQQALEKAAFVLMVCRQLFSASDAEGLDT
jgi:HEPN domain-containing protein